MSLAERVAAEQVAYWRAEGEALADCWEALGYRVGPHRHVGRSWAELGGYLARIWVDAVRWSLREAA